MKPLNETHTLLMSYAAKHYTPTVSGTIPQLASWYERVAGIRVPERTFKRHAKALTDAGLIDVSHSARRTYYTLLDFEYEVPNAVFVPCSSPGQFEIKFDGTSTTSYEQQLAETDPALIHQRVMNSIDPADIDALEASWVMSEAAA
jgi:DNA-binding transcriptional ArsR family regulator